MKKLLLLLLLAACAHGTPTPVDTAIVWDDYTDPDATGFFLYWSHGASPGTYVDTRKVDIGLRNPEAAIVKTEIPSAKAAMCLRLTAYDAAGNESAYSNEACGFFGLTSPTNATVQ